MLTASYKKKLLMFFCVAAVLFFINPAIGQTALRQLESWAGRSINSYSVPAPSAPSSSSGGGTYRNPFVKTFEQKQDEARDHYQKALKEMNSRNWEDAIRMLNKAIRKDPYTQYYKDKLREAETTLAKEKQQNKEYQDRIKQQEEASKRLEEEKRRIEEARLEKERKEQEAIKEKIMEAKETIIAFKKDIKYAQGHLKNFTKSLTNNNADLEKWGKEVDDAYNRVLEDSKGYLSSMFIKYNMLQGILKRSYVEALYKRTGNLCKSSNPEIQKWFAKELKKIDVRIDEVQDVVDRVSLSGDMAELLSGDKEQAGRNLKILMFLNGVLETAHISDYDNLIKEVEKPFGLTNMPGEYFEQAKMIGETYSNIGAECFGWYHIRKLNASNEEMAKKVAIFSAGMEQRMKEIDCLEKCIKKYSDRCLEGCTGKTKWSTPPPPLLFNNRNW
jgi:tetratricopeptide (TPR) repeat protein